MWFNQFSTVGPDFPRFKADQPLIQLRLQTRTVFQVRSAIEQGGLNISRRMKVALESNSNVKLWNLCDICKLKQEAGVWSMGAACGIKFLQ
uniref:Uncharacterized protein n=1 Tax=Lupinus angustifolius TaxID=3871 RepID=L0P101_LUPAN|nr:hypothetical protein [Lupinus angustifolius]